jgi:hypothetical protein
MLITNVKVNSLCHSDSLKRRLLVVGPIFAEANYMNHANRKLVVIQQRLCRIKLFLRLTSPDRINLCKCNLFCSPYLNVEIVNRSEVNLGPYTSAGNDPQTRSMTSLEQLTNYIARSEFTCSAAVS